MNTTLLMRNIIQQRQVAPVYYWFQNMNWGTLTNIFHHKWYLLFYIMRFQLLNNNSQCVFTLSKDNFSTFSRRFLMQLMPRLRRCFNCYYPQPPALWLQVWAGWVAMKLAGSNELEATRWPTQRAFSTWGSDGECLKWHGGLPQLVLQHSGQQLSCPEGMSSKQ